MKPIKGLQMDNRPSEQPDETYPFAKNGIQYDMNGAVINEPGFRKLALVTPYVLHGVIETDSKPILFSTNNTNSAIGYFNPTTELYEPIVDDSNWALAPAKLGFTTDNYITGVAQRNYKGEMVAAFTDKSTFPMYLNCDNPNLKSINDLRLFPYFAPPTLTITQSQGGVLLPGTYYVAIGYEKNDGTSTPYSAVSNGTFVTPDSTGQSTNKAISITISNADTNYDMVRIAIISKISGKTVAVLLNDLLPITGSDINYTYTGVNASSDLDVSAILTPPAIYSKVNTMGQLNDALYIGVLEKEKDLDDMQPYASTVIMEFQSELMDATNPSQDHVTGIKKSRMHEEVYAIYIRYRKTRGGTTKWFTVPGPAPLAADLLNSTEAAASGYTGGAVPVYKVEDTIHYFDPVGFTGATGVWQNTTEKYPDTVDFDATSIGGANLRNQPVRHHKMPSLRWCKANLYPNEDLYGQTKLDILGLRALNVRIPDKYIGIINGYEIGYAVRSTGNMTVFGQSIMLHGCTDNRSTGKPLGNIPIYTSGGNFSSSIYMPDGYGYDYGNSMLELRKDTVRFHAFDILFNKPAVKPDLISAQFKLHRNLSVNSTPPDYLEDGFIAASHDAPLVILIDYTKGSKPVQMTAGNKLRAFGSSFYLPNTANANQFVNIRHENVFAGTLLGTPLTLQNSHSAFRVKRGDYTEPALGLPQFEEAYLVNLTAIKSDLYSNYYSQTLVSAGPAKVLTDITPFWGGDVFNCDYTFHTYGRHDALDTEGQVNKGKKIIHRIVCESVSNIAVRYEIPGNTYSQWYPHNGVAAQNPLQCYPTLQDRAQDPNQFGYSKDFNALNDLIDSTVYSPFREYIYKFPYRIHRGGKNNRQSKPRAWRTFLPLDYYECQKNMGMIIHLEGMDDHLLIHHENALFITQDKTKLDSGVLSITLGSGDIFQFEPQEAISAKLGYAGCQHDLACIKTPMGYLFVDAKQGEIYIFKGKPENLNAGINTFLRDFLKITDKNVFTGNGITLGWDQRYKRFLLTVKNRKVNTPTTVVKQFVDTPAFWNNLNVGDVVNYKNRLVVFRGPNDTTYNCPQIPVVPSVTWSPINPFCMVNNASPVANTGMKGYASRQRLGGSPSPYIEPNTQNGGIGPYFPPVMDTTTCPIPPPVTSWQGINPFCLKGYTSACPTGWTLSSDGTYCYMINQVPATSSGGSTILLAHFQLGVYGSNGTVVHKLGGYNADGTWPTGDSTKWPNIYTSQGPGRYPYANQISYNTGLWNNPNSVITAGRLNSAGVWQQGNQGYIGTLGFARQINIPTAGVYYIGVGSDDYGTIKIDGVAIVTQSVTNISGANYLNAPSNDALFKHWIMYPVQLTAGPHLFELISTNLQAQGILGMEIYIGSESQLINLAPDGLVLNSTYLFSTKDVIDGSPFDTGNYNCNAYPGYSLVNDNGTYYCRKINTQGANPVGVNTGMKGFNDRIRLLNNVADGYQEPNNTNSPVQVGIGPYINPVLDTVACPTSGPPPSPIPVPIIGTVSRSCSDQSCSVIGNVSLTFNFQVPLPVPITVWIGEVISLFNSTRQFTGSGAFPSPLYGLAVGATPNTQVNYAGGTNTPFEINIPAGVTSYTVNESIFQTGNDQVPLANWRCNSCQFPIVALYMKLTAPVAGYQLQLTAANSPSIIVYNV